MGLLPFMFLVMMILMMMHPMLTPPHDADDDDDEDELMMNMTQMKLVNIRDEISSRNGQVLPTVFRFTQFQKPGQAYIYTYMNIYIYIHVMYTAMVCMVLS